MTELDLLNLARDTTQSEIGYFNEMITINFAMIVAIFYFLNQAPIAMKVFAYAAFLIGTLFLFGQMLFETNVKISILQALRALPHPHPVTVRYLALYDSWLTTVISVLLNGAVWLLCLGTAYLLFIWNKAAHVKGA
ncbi:MAG: hypothetical protein JSR60_03240 [Proteobacteria bacterium]|nr:hypothetical protein [Pseudomonadota bacterium]